MGLAKAVGDYLAQSMWIDGEDGPFRGRFIVFRPKTVGGPVWLREGMEWAGCVARAAG